MIICFILTLLLIFLSLITSKLEIQILKFYFDTKSQNYLSNNLQINIIIKIFFQIPIFKIKLNISKIKKIAKKQIIKNIIDKEKQKIREKTNLRNLQDLKEFKSTKNLNNLKTIKNLKIKIDKVDLKIILGTDNATITSVIIPMISTLIVFLLNNHTQKYNKNKKFKVEPVYNNQNLLKINFSGIFQIKLIHIINTICILKRSKFV